MRQRMLAPFTRLLLLSGALLCACSGETATYAPYEGTAYPNQRPRFEKNGRLLGYVANRKSDTISVIDLDAMAELGQAPVGRDPVDTDGPRHFTIDEPAGLAYVALSYFLSIPSPHAEDEGGAAQRFGYVAALDLNDLGMVGERRLEPSAHDIAFNPLTQQLVVSHYDTVKYLEPDLAARRASLDFIAPASGLRDGSAKLRTLTLCAAPTAVVLKSDGSRAFVACTGEDSVAVVDTANAVELTRIPAGPDGANKPIALTTDGKDERLVVSNQIARAIAIYSMLDQPALITHLAFVGFPMFPTWTSDTTLIVPTQQGLTDMALVEVTGSSAKILLEVDYDNAQCENPGAVTRSKDGRVFVVCEGNQFAPGSVIQIDPTTLEILARVEVGIYPDHLALRE